MATIEAHRPHVGAIHHDAGAAAYALEEADARRREAQKVARKRQTWVHVAGRLLIAVLFIVSGIAKMMTFDSTLEAMTELGVASPGMLLPIAIAVELIGGALVLVGFRAREVAIGLIVYLIALTILIHGDLSIPLNRSFALANVAIMGGLLMVVSHGAGLLSADTEIARRNARRYGA